MLGVEAWERLLTKSFRVYCVMRSRPIVTWRVLSVIFAARRPGRASLLSVPGGSVATTW